MFKSLNASDCNRQEQMRATWFMFPFALAACASQEPISESEQRINALASERRGEERFPVLRPLPNRKEALGQGETGDTRQELTDAAVPLRALTGEASAAPAEPSLGEVAAELRAMVAALRDQQDTPPPADIEALGFPTPPPLED
jgi:hypothetical protein